MTSTTPWYQRLNWVNTLFLTITFVASVASIPVYLYYYGPSWGMVAMLFGYGTVTAMSITCGYHRLFSHLSYDAHPVVRFFFLIFGAAAFQGSCLQWGTDHRRHHRFVDTEQDPYNINKGFFWAHMGWLMIKDDPKYIGKYEKDLERDPMIAWQHKYFEVIAFAMGFGFPTLVGWAFGNALLGFVWGGVVRVVYTNHCTFLINSLAHTIGNRPYNPNQTARDSIVMAILAYGEGYHNYHHHFASDYRNGVRWYQWDPTKWVIRGLSFVGLTYRLKLIPASEILLCRMRIEQQLLLQRGIPADKISSLKLRVEEAQKRWRTLKDDYKVFKANMKATSEQRLLQFKADIRIAKLEFKMACRQWGALCRTFRVHPT